MPAKKIFPTTINGPAKMNRPAGDFLQASLGLIGFPRWIDLRVRTTARRPVARLHDRAMAKTMDHAGRSPGGELSITLVHTTPTRPMYPLNNARPTHAMSARRHQYPKPRRYQVVPKSGTKRLPGDGNGEGTGQSRLSEKSLKVITAHFSHQKSLFQTDLTPLTTTAPVSYRSSPTLEKVLAVPYNRPLPTPPCSVKSSVQCSCNA